MAAWQDPSAPTKPPPMAFALTVNVFAWAVWLALVVTSVDGQSLTIGAAEHRSGERHRQDAVEVEALWLTDHALVSANASFRHGADDNSNRPWPPFLQVTAGPRIGWLALTAGLQSYPWSVDRWTWLAGPRVDVPLGHRLSLHLSNVWRQEGLVETTMRPWTSRFVFRLDFRVVG